MLVGLRGHASSYRTSRATSIKMRRAKREPSKNPPSEPPQGRRRIRELRSARCDRGKHRAGGLPVADSDSHGAIGVVANLQSCAVEHLPPRLTPWREIHEVGV